MRIRKAENLEEVEDLVGRCFTPRTAPRYHRLQDALIGRVDGRDVAVAAFSVNSLHPNGRKAIVAVLPEFRRKGFGRRIHSALLAALPTGSSVFVNGFDDQVVARSFFQELGYRRCNRCHLLEIDLQRISDEVPLPGAKSYFELQRSGFDLDAIRDFLVARYIASHQWDPPRPIEDPIWKLLREEQNVDLQHSFALVEVDRVLAASDARTNGTIDGFSFAIGWTYFDERPDLSPIDLSKSVYVPQMRKALRSGYSVSYMELDQAHPVDELLGWLPVTKHEVFEHHCLKT
jgi:GNAT superfamily N-acetyltransferase